jgi:hypothetical protein
MTRTTIRLPDDLMRRARKRAAEKGRTLTSLIEEGLKPLLVEPKRGPRKRIRLPVSRLPAAHYRALISIGPPTSRTGWASHDPSRRQSARECFPSRHSDHARCQRWLESVVNRDSRYGMYPQVLGGVVRVATHPRVFSESSDLDEVIGFCEVLMEAPYCVLIQPGPQHWSIFSRLCKEEDARGNLVRMPGSPHWPLNPAASGSLSTEITPDLRVFAGVRLSDGELPHTRHGEWPRDGYAVLSPRALK